MFEVIVSFFPAKALITACAPIPMAVAVKIVNPTLSTVDSTPPMAGGLISLAATGLSVAYLSQKSGSEQPIQPLPTPIGQLVPSLYLTIEQLLKVKVPYIPSYINRNYSLHLHPPILQQTPQHQSGLFFHNYREFCIQKRI